VANARSRHTGGHGMRCADVTNHAQTRASSSSVVRPCVPPPHAISTKSSTRAPLAWSVACCRVPMPRSFDDSDDESARLHGAVPLPEEEYWSDEERGGAGDAEARPLDGPGPWGQQLQRTLGGPKVEEPVSLALLARLFAYVAAFSLALAFCEVLTMWASRRVAWAVRPRSLFALAWACTRCLCILALPYWYATFSAHMRCTTQLPLLRSLVTAYGLLKHPAVWKARTCLEYSSLAGSHPPQELIPPRRKVLHGAVP